MILTDANKSFVSRTNGEAHSIDLRVLAPIMNKYLESVRFINRHSEIIGIGVEHYRQTSFISSDINPLKYSGF